MLAMALVPIVTVFVFGPALWLYVRRRRSS